MEVLVAVLALGGLHRGMPHDQKDVVYLLALVERPLSECAAALPALESEPQIFLHGALQRADPPVRSQGECPNPMAKAYNLNFMRNHAKMYISSTRMDELMPMIQEIMGSGIKHADATHIACAIDSGCDCLITTDDRMLRYKDDRITIISPNDMLYIMEGLR